MFFVNDKGNNGNDSNNGKDNGNNSTIDDGEKDGNNNDANDQTSWHDAKFFHVLSIKGKTNDHGNDANQNDQNIWHQQKNPKRIVLKRVFWVVI